MSSTTERGGGSLSWWQGLRFSVSMQENYVPTLLKIAEVPIHIETALIVLFLMVGLGQRLYWFVSDWSMQRRWFLVNNSERFKENWAERLLWQWTMNVDDFIFWYKPIVSYSESCLFLVCVLCLLWFVFSIWHSVILALVFPSYVSVFMFTFDLSRSTPRLCFIFRLLPGLTQFQ